MLVSCEESKNERKARERDETYKLQEESKQRFLSRFSHAVGFEDLHAEKLTFEVQDYISANPDHIFLTDNYVDEFDVYDDGTSLKLICQIWSDDWLELVCTREQAVRLSTVRKQNDVPQILIFTLISASRPQNNLSADVEGDGDDISAFIVSGMTRYYKGNLIDFGPPDTF